MILNFSPGTIATAKACGPHSGPGRGAIDTVRGLSSAGDLDMIPAMNYVFSVDRLPMVTGRTLAEAMAALEARLASLPQVQLAAAQTGAPPFSVRSKICAITRMPQKNTALWKGCYRNCRLGLPDAEQSA